MPKSAKSSKATDASQHQPAYQSSPVVLPPFEGTDPSSLIFPEWVDHEINAEKWDVSKGKVGKGDHTYRDPHTYQMPMSINVHDWKRPTELFPNVELTIFKESGEYTDFSGCRHVLHCEFMRAFISSIGILEYMGHTKPWPIEATGPNYHANTERDPWKPWHHIYSMCKAGGGHVHNPMYNSAGKYILRLFWMGSWRKITIDDLLPIDRLYNVLLPTVEILPNIEVLSSPSKSITEKQSIQLWPFLLCKALLKIANFTWTHDEEIVDFDIINTLTGWIVQKIPIIELTMDDVWKMCQAYSEHYSWPEDEVKPTKVDKKSTKEGHEVKAKKGKDAASKKTKDTTSKKSSKKESSSTSKSKAPADVQGKNVPLYCLVAHLKNLRYANPDTIPGVTPCWSHLFLIDQSRDIPLEKPSNLGEVLPRWKKFRWVQWATKQGLYNELSSQTKFIKMVSNFKKVFEFKIYKNVTQLTLKLPKNQAEIKDPTPRHKVEEPKKEKKAHKVKDELEKQSSTKKSRSSQESKRSVSFHFDPPPDPSIWIDFNHIYPYIDFLYVFLKPSQFPTYIKMSDIRNDKPVVKGKGKDVGGQNRQDITWSHFLRDSRNEPLFMFMDTIDTKYVAFNLSQCGNSDIIISEEDITLCRNMNTVVQSVHRPLSFLTLEEFNWRTEEIGKKVASLTTFGTKSMVLSIKRGRGVYRIWLQSNTSYVFTILSDVPIIIGSSEVVLEAMQMDSPQFLQVHTLVATAIGELIQAFGTPRYVEAMRYFHVVYSPHGNPKYIRRIVQAGVYDELKSVLYEYYGDARQYRHAIMVLFLNPDLVMNPFKVEVAAHQDSRKSSVLVPSEPQEGIVYVDVYGQKFTGAMNQILAAIVKEDNNVYSEQEEEKAAVVLQSFFKMIRIRRILSYHNPEDKKHLSIFETLKTIYKDIFSVQNRGKYVLPCIRRLVLYSSQVFDIRPYFQTYEDLNNVVHYQYFIGTVNVAPHTWNTIARMDFQVVVDEIEIVKICGYCNLKQYTVRVFDNDTKTEMKRFTNSVTVNSYQKNEKGYSVLVAGHSHDVSTVFWKCCFISLKKSANSNLLITEKVVVTDVLQDIYVPNVNKLIARCLIAITKSAWLTVRFSCSNSDVKIKLLCRDERTNAQQEIRGTGTVILSHIELNVAEATLLSEQNIQITHPKVRRRGSYKSTSPILRSTSSTKKLAAAVAAAEPTQFLIEAYVLGDSWTLTSDEIVTTEHAKRSKLLGPTIHPELRSFASSITGFRSVGETLDPYWCLQAVHEKGDSLSICIDRRREEEIAALKMAWYDADPERYLYSKKAREEYLDKLMLEPSVSGSEVAQWTSAPDFASGDRRRKLPSKSTFDEELVVLLEALEIPPSSAHSMNLPQLSSIKLESILVNPEDVENALTNVEEDIENYHKRREEYLDNVVDLLETYIKQNVKVRDWFQDSRDKSEQLITEAYEGRDKYIAGVLEEEKAKRVAAKRAKGSKKGTKASTKSKK